MKDDILVMEIHSAEYMTFIVPSAKQNNLFHPGYIEVVPIDIRKGRDLPS